MNVATLISVTAALLLAGMGLVFLALGRAPGWARARLFAVIAFSGSAYSAVDIVFSVPTIDVETARVIGLLNFLLASIHSIAWLSYAFSSPDRPLRDLSPRLRAVAGATLILGVVALVPGAATGNDLRVIRVPSLGVVYHQWGTTPFGDALSVWLAGVLLLPYISFIRALLRGEPHAGVRVASFTVFFACAIVELLVTDGIIEFIYMADVGFVAVALGLLVESVSRVMADAQALAALGRDLSSQVDRRTRERDEARDALEHAERLAALGRLAAGVGHEINNPLTYVRANLEYLGTNLATGTIPDDAAAVVEEALGGTERIRRIVDDLRAYALPVSERPEAVSIDDVIRSSMKVAAHHLHHVAPVTVELGECPRVFADALRLSQVFVNLLINAGHAVRESGRTDPSIVVRSRVGEGGRVVVEVRDNGVGIPPELLLRLGEPYFSTRIDRGGTGLGLFVSRGIIVSYSGTLEFESTTGVGTVARVSLPSLERAVPSRPRLPETEPQAAAAEDPALPREGEERRRALVIDDEPAVARALGRMLPAFDVTIASDGTEAMERLAHDAPYDVVLCDVMMPGMTGADVYETVASTRPSLLPRLVFVTGGATIPEVASFLRRDGVRHLVKPVDRAALDAAVATVGTRGR